MWWMDDDWGIHILGNPGNPHLIISILHYSYKPTSLTMGPPPVGIQRYPMAIRTVLVQFYALLLSFTIRTTPACIAYIFVYDISDSADVLSSWPFWCLFCCFPSLSPIPQTHADLVKAHIYNYFGAWVPKFWGLHPICLLALRQSNIRIDDTDLTATPLSSP